MKKMIMALGAILLVCLSVSVQAAPQSADFLSGSKATSYKYVEDSSSSTVTLVAGVANQTVSLYKYILSASTADNFYFQCGSTQKTGRVYLGANGGLDATFYPLYIRCASGEALNLVKATSSTPVGVSVWFNQQ